MYTRQGPIPTWDKPVMVCLKSLVTRHISIGLPRKDEIGLDEVMTRRVLSDGDFGYDIFDENYPSTQTTCYRRLLITYHTSEPSRTMTSFGGGVPR